jgi:hypothetical protein
MKLANALRKLAVPDNPAIVQQVIGLTAELTAIEADIFAQEDQMNTLVDRLYGLSEADMRMVGNVEGKESVHKRRVSDFALGGAARGSKD